MIPLPLLSTGRYREGHQSGSKLEFSLARASSEVSYKVREMILFCIEVDEVLLDGTKCNYAISCLL